MLESKKELQFYIVALYNKLFENFLKTIVFGFSMFFKYEWKEECINCNFLILSLSFLHIFIYLFID